MRDPRFAPLITAIETDLAANLATGASVAVWLDDEIIYVGGFGTADPTGARAPDEETVFQIGSDTKKIAAILLLRQIAAGRARLESTVGDVLTDLTMPMAPGYLGATAHELISQQGGIVDGTGDFSTSTSDGVLRSYTYGGFSREYYAMAPPGHFFNYSNPNFSVAGLMTEQLAGASWADLARDELFAPLGMTRSFARKSEVDGNHAVGVGISDPMDTTPGPVSFEDTWENAFVRPSGLVWSTPSDQMRLARFLVDGDARVLPDELVRRMHEPHVATLADLPGQYGYGLAIAPGFNLGSNYYDAEVWSHGGNTYQQSSTFFILPEQRFAISILSNGLRGDFTASVVAAFQSLVTLPAPSVAPAIPRDEAAITALSGTYVDDYTVGDMIIAREGATLTLSIPALDMAGVAYDRVITPASTRVWSVVINGQTLVLRVQEGPTGETHLIHRRFVATRRTAATSLSLPSSVRRPQPSREQILHALFGGQTLDPAPSAPLGQPF